VGVSVGRVVSVAVRVAVQVNEGVSVAVAGAIIGMDFVGSISGNGVIVDVGGRVGTIPRLFGSFGENGL